MVVPLVLDTDMGSDVDDALALAFALRHPDIDLRAVTTVADDTTMRANIARKLTLLAGRGGIEVAAGIGDVTPPAGRRSWGGHEGRGLLEPGETLDISTRHAVTVLADALGHLAGGAPEVVTVGMQTNIAAALRRDESAPGGLRRLHVMGGVFGPVEDLDQSLPPSIDHNLNCDPAGALVSLNSGLRIVYVPCDVTIKTELTMDHVEELRRGDPLCRALAALIDVWREVQGEMMPPKRAALLHDPLAVACTVDRRFVTSEELHVTAAMHNGRVRTFVDPLEGSPAEVITSVDAEGFADFWLATVLGRLSDLRPSAR
ncbi:MAG: nucleoside hydrolase [Actinobacteria bacterium]|nr:nucleoside hydrolase [Actinomycetota bacterium]